MFDDIDYKTYKRTTDHIRRFTDVFFGTTVISQLLFFIPYFSTRDYAGNFYISNFNLYVCVFATFFLYFTLVRLANSYDKYYREEFFAANSPRCKFKARILFWLTNKRFWIEFAIFAGIYILIPLEVLHYGIVYFLSSKEAIFQNKAFVLFLILGLMFILNIWARMTAIKFWIYDKEVKEAETVSGKKLSRKTSYFKEYMIAIFAYLIGSLGMERALFYIFFIVSPFLSLALNNFTSFVILLGAIIFIPYVIRGIRSLYIRFSFIKKLKKLCKQKKYRLSLIKSPYISVFKMFEGESFNVSIGLKTYSCKLVASTRRHTPLYLQPNGVGVFIRKFYILRAEVFEYKKSFIYDYDSKNKRILIINPVAKNLYSNYGQGMVEELDNGDIIGGFEIYTATGFLNALERDVIDK